MAEQTQIKIYDITLDEMRPATQEDVDHLHAVAQECWALRTILRALAESYPRGTQPDPQRYRTLLSKLEA